MVDQGYQCQCTPDRHGQVCQYGNCRFYMYILQTFGHADSLKAPGYELRLVKPLAFHQTIIYLLVIVNEDLHCRYIVVTA